MFDYVSAQEVLILRKIRAHDSGLYLTSDQRIRLELLGLITDGPSGIHLTTKGARVAGVGLDDYHRSEFEPLIVKLAS